MSSNSAENGQKLQQAAKAITPLPKMQSFIAISIQFCEAAEINVLFPFVAFMVDDYGYTGERLGVYCGWLAASFCAAQFCSAMVWGRLSDQYGRKPILIWGVLGAGLAMIVFGTAKTYSQAMLGRIISGLLSGNTGVNKSFIAEITDDTNRSLGFSLISIAWFVGTVIGPLIGGLLAKPATKYPGIFPPSGLFGEYPYLLPCLVCCTLNMITCILTTLFMIEPSRESEQEQEQREYQEQQSNLKEIEMIRERVKNDSTTEDADDATAFTSIDINANPNTRYVPSGIGGGGVAGQLNKLTGVVKGRQGGKRLAEKVGIGADSRSQLPTVNPIYKQLDLEDGDEEEAAAEEASFGCSPQDETPDSRQIRTQYEQLLASVDRKSAVLDETNTDDVGNVDCSIDDDRDSLAFSASTSTSPRSTTSSAALLSNGGSCDEEDDVFDIERGRGGGSNGGYAMIGTKSSSPNEDIRNPNISPMKPSSQETEDAFVEDEYFEICGLFGKPPGDDGKKIPVTRRKLVVLTSICYGALAMAHMILDQTLPLLYKQSRREDGMSFNTSQIGIVISISGFVSLIFSVYKLPELMREYSIQWLFSLTVRWTIPFVIGFPLVGLLDYALSDGDGNSDAFSDVVIWTLLLILSMLKNCIATVSFNAVFIQISHSVQSFELGVANGLSQSFASLARTLGPAFGGYLWGQSVHWHFTFLNFLFICLLLIWVQRVNRHLKPLDKTRSRRAKAGAGVSSSPAPIEDSSSVNSVARKLQSNCLTPDPALEPPDVGALAGGGGGTGMGSFTTNSLHFDEETREVVAGPSRSRSSSGAAVVALQRNTSNGSSDGIISATKPNLDLTSSAHTTTRDLNTSNEQNSGPLLFSPSSGASNSIEM